MRLPGTEDWPLEHVEAHIAFERGFANDAAHLLGDFYGANFGSEASKLAFLRPTDAIYARGKAAELAFATGNVPLGFEICLEVVAKDYPATPMQAAYFAAIGSVTRTIQVHLLPNGAAIFGLSRLKEGLPISWPEEDSNFAATLMRLLLPTVTASRGLEDFLSFEVWADAKPQIMEKFGGSLEFRALLGGSHDLARGQRSAAILAMETQYNAHLSVMRRDQYHWKLMQPRGQLIDWPLLCTWVTLSGFGKAFGHQEIPILNPDADFIRWLGGEIVAAADRSLGSVQ